MEDTNDNRTLKTESTGITRDIEKTHEPLKLKDPNEEEHSTQQVQQVQQAQQAPEGDTRDSGENKEMGSEDDVDPADQIEPFDWDGLHERYHLAMNKASAEERELMNEWALLMDYFKIWADAGANQESDRTFHRLRTRMTYVSNSEQKLEKTRQHYIGVVRAFESALALLRNTGFDG